MRQNRFIATKDHFLIIAASNELGDELWAGHLEFRGAKFSTQTTNAMGFLVKGSVNSFINTSEQGEDWHHYAEASHPVMMIRDKGFTNFGIVSTSDETVFGSSPATGSRGKSRSLTPPKPLPHRILWGRSSHKMLRRRPMLRIAHR